MSFSSAEIYQGKQKLTLCCPDFQNLLDKTVLPDIGNIVNSVFFKTVVRRDASLELQGGDDVRIKVTGNKLGVVNLRTHVKRTYSVLDYQTGGEVQFINSRILHNANGIWNEHIRSHERPLSSEETLKRRRVGPNPVRTDDEETDRLKSQIQTLEDNLRQLKALSKEEREANKKEVKDLSDKLKDTKVQNGKNLETIEDLKDQLTETNKQKTTTENVKDDLSEQIKSLKETHHSELEKLREQLTFAQAINEENQQKIQSLENSNETSSEELKQIHDDKEISEQKVKDLSEKISQLEQDHEQQVAALSKQLEKTQKESLENQHSTEVLAATLSDMQKKQTSSEEELQHLTEELDQVSRNKQQLESDLNTARQEHQGDQNRISTLEKDLQEEKKKFEELGDAIGSLKSDLNDAYAQNRNLRDRYNMQQESLEEAVRPYETKMNLLIAQMEELEHEVAQLSHEKDELNIALEQKEKSMQETQKMHSDLLNINTELKAEKKKKLKAAELRLNALKEEISRLEEKNDAAKKTQESLVSKIFTLNSQLSLKQENHQKVQSRFKETISKQTAENEGLQNDLKITTEKNHQAIETIDSLRVELTTMADENLLANQIIDESFVEISRRDKEMDTLKQENEQLRAQIKSLEDLIRARRSISNDLLKEKDKLLAEIAGNEKKLAELINTVVQPKEVQSLNDSASELPPGSPEHEESAPSVTPEVAKTIGTLTKTIEASTDIKFKIKKTSVSPMHANRVLLNLTNIDPNKPMPEHIQNDLAAKRSYEKVVSLIKQNPPSTKCAIWRKDSMRRTFMFMNELKAEIDEILKKEPSKQLTQEKADKLMKVLTPNGFPYWAEKIIAFEYIIKAVGKDETITRTKEIRELLAEKQLIEDLKTQLRNLMQAIEQKKVVV